MQVIENTNLWKHTLGLQKKGDPHKEARALLVVEFTKMRERVEELLKSIPEYCKGLTVHDISHIDALWEMADLVIGDEVDLNPAEAFVFGASALIHDAGLTAVSLRGGKEELKRRPEWADVEKSQGTSTSEEVTMFTVLREIHASLAESLITTSWSHGSIKDKYLLENDELRNAYGMSIGRIAHSHHWDIERVSEHLRRDVGAGPKLPPEWVVDEIKLACILRCADAAHIDNRRAPLFAYTLNKPVGEADLHWRFQGKINKPTRRTDAIVYSSGSAFELTDAEAWWRCFDAVRVLDHELSASNALLQDLGYQKGLAVARVAGAESPRMLQRHVATHGWVPVSAEIKVSDPAHLAATLGGQNLYGRDVLPPLRELIQNGVDAVRARRTYEDRDERWGKVRLTISSVPGDEEGNVFLHVDDQGVGMSQSVLSGPLLDFGKSIWRSPLLREEYPGLASKGLKPIGKFGIGFFSAFAISGNVAVISRKFDAGQDDIRVIQFDGLRNRPILRPANKGELPTDYTTRVTLKLPYKTLSAPYYTGRREHLVQLIDRLKALVAALDVEFEFKDELSGASFQHDPDWSAVSPERFLSELLATIEPKRRELVIASHAPRLTVLTDGDGVVVGRAALRMLRDDAMPEFQGISVGGIVVVDHIHEYRRSTGAVTRIPLPYVGVLQGDTDDISRQQAGVSLPDSSIFDWAKRQAAIIDKNKYTPFQQISAARALVRLGVDSGSLPFCFIGGRFVSFAEFEKTVLASQSILLPLNETYGKAFRVMSVTELPPTYFVLAPVDNLLTTVARGREDLVPDALGRKIVEGTHGSEVDEGDLNLSVELQHLVELIEKTWSAKPRLSIEVMQLFQNDLYEKPAGGWCFVLRRKP